MLAPARVSFRSSARELHYAWREWRQPESARIDDIEIALDGAWATPPVRSAMYRSLYELEERRILAGTLKGGDIYLELGCGVGLMATLAARIVTSGMVIAIEADPAMAAVTHSTLESNGARADVRNVVLARAPHAEATTFYVHDDFWSSSLEPNGQTRAVTVPLADFDQTIRDAGASYLMVDIEGDEARLLAGGVPECVKTICVETHPAVTGTDAQSRMVGSLLADGFTLDLDCSELPVLLFTRP